MLLCFMISHWTCIIINKQVLQLRMDHHTMKEHNMDKKKEVVVTKVGNNKLNKYVGLYREKRWKLRTYLEQQLQFLTI